MGKRKIRVYGKINLYETSIVGIPSYPDAHASVDSFSFIKSIKKSLVNELEELPQTIINEKEVKEKMEDQTQPTDKTVTETLDKSIELVKEETVDKSVQPVQITPEKISELLKDALKTAMDEFETKRGLVSTEKVKTSQEIVKEMSLGELAVASGLFIPK